MKPFEVAIFVVAALFAALGWPRSAHAHDPFEITSDARVAADRLELDVTMARTTALSVCGETELEACTRTLYVVKAAGQELAPLSARVQWSPENDLEVRLTYPPPASGNLSFDALYLQRLPDPTYGVALTVTGRGRFLGQALLRAEAPTFAVDVPAARPTVAEPGPAARPAPTPKFTEYLVLGLRHVLGGFDHLLFLFGLLAVCRRWGQALGIVTCFTLAHSLSLALATFGLLVPPSSWVEPVIAASIVFVGVQNLLSPEQPQGRWLVTLGFGLIHGFGFAGALRELGLGSGFAIAPALLAFNLGIELGQLVVLALVLPILWRLRSVNLFDRYGARALSLLVAAAGLFWFVERLVPATVTPSKSAALAQRAE